MLFGRQRERGVLDRLLVGARTAGGAIVVLGEPGIGKTALMEQAVTSAQDFRALRTAGQEGETELAYAALQQLCAPGLDRLVRLPAPQRDAVRDYENLPASHEAMILWTMIALMTRRLTQPTELSDAYLQNRIICASPAGSLAHASTSNRRLARPSTERHDRVDDRRHRQRHAGQRISMPGAQRPLSGVGGPYYDDSLAGLIESGGRRLPVPACELIRSVRGPIFLGICR